MIDFLNRQKRDTFKSMLDHGLVMIHLDPRRDGVVVPAQFASDPVLRLNIAYGFNLPALDIDDDGIFAVLSFRGANFGCTVPWPAVFAMTSPDAGHEGRVWPACVPEEVGVQTPQAAPLRLVGGEDV
jgi:stringent starvation protein B